MGQRRGGRATVSCGKSWRMWAGQGQRRSALREEESRGWGRSWWKESPPGRLEVCKTGRLRRWGPVLGDLSTRDADRNLKYCSLGMEHLLEPEI